MAELIAGAVEGIPETAVERIVKAVAGYAGKILVRTGAGEADCRSIMGLLCLAMEQGTELTVLVDGPDEDSELSRPAGPSTTARPEGPGAG